jgi:DNA-directed RNA polymerase subunit H (RpoH/RPB5)
MTLKCPNHVLQTCAEMLEARGHTRIQRKTPTDKPITTVIVADNARVYWVTQEPRVSVMLARELVLQKGKHLNRTHILISTDKMTSQAATVIEGFDHIEHFTCMELLFNITKHCLYVPHVLMELDEERAFLSKTKYLKKNFPTLLTRDMVCRFFKFPIDRLVRIHRRPGGSMQPHFYYRCVRDASCGS